MILTDTSYTIETGRLVLRHWRLDDAESLYRYASDQRVSSMALWPCHTSVEMSRMVIRDFFLPEIATFAIVVKPSDIPVGCIGLVPPGHEHYDVVEGEREVGYWIGHDYWGMGMTTEALLAIVDSCRMCSAFKSLLITADSRNIASQRVAEKSGFSHVADYVSPDGISSKAFRLVLNQSE